MTHPTLQWSPVVYNHPSSSNWSSFQIGTRTAPLPLDNRSNLLHRRIGGTMLDRRQFGAPPFHKIWLAVGAKSASRGLGAEHPFVVATYHRRPIRDSGACKPKDAVCMTCSRSAGEKACMPVLEVLYVRTQAHSHNPVSGLLYFPSFHIFLSIVA